MASRLGPHQSVMGNLASSNLVSASIFSPSLVDKSAHLRDIVLLIVPVHNAADHPFQPQF